MPDFFRKLKEPRNAFLMMSIVVIFAIPFPVLYLRENIYSLAETAADSIPKISESEYYDVNMSVKERSMNFPDGSKFAVFRYTFEKGIENGKRLTKSIDISGEDITLRWQNYSGDTPRWETSKDLQNIPKSTLFIETTNECLIISVPALYYNRFDNKTIENLPDLELPCIIEENDGGYTVRFVFQPVDSTVGEGWYFKTNGPFTNRNKHTEAILLSQDLHKERRFCLDGYYFRTYTTYDPYKENGFFRNPANFSGAHMLRNTSLGAINNLGYAMTAICAQNQNSNGYWETGPKSTWLYADYGIEYDFYDTRFSTDFARSLLIAYKRYNDIEMLDRAIAYAEFIIGFADKYGYKLNENALLIPDYYSESMNKKPHVSLNHQLCELNFLLELYMVTGNERYYDISMRILKGIELTRDDWIMADGNLEYAILYDVSVNTMKDYPYLTYNDLFETKKLLKELSIESDAISVLMESKKGWMDKNGVTGYLK